MHKGYTLCVEIAPNGNGMSLGTHVAIFICIVKGEQDETLEWSFIHQITFYGYRVRYDKSSNMSPYVMETFRAGGDGNLASYDRPRIPINWGCGRPFFIRHNELKEHFLTDDGALLIKCVITD